MNCRDFSRIVAETPGRNRLPSDARKHVSGCEQCQQLLDAFEAPFEAGCSVPEPVIGRIQERLLATLRPVSPLPPTQLLLAGFIVVFLLVAAAGGIGLGPLGLRVLSSFQTLVIFSTLALGSATAVYSLTQHMVPGSNSHGLQSGLLPAIVLGALFCATSLIFHPGEDAHFWAKSSVCLAIGLGFSAIAAIPFWLLLRRGVMLNPLAAGATAGLLAGLVGVTILEIHCPILASHLAAALLCSLFGLAIAAAAGARAKF